MSRRPCPMHGPGCRGPWSSLSSTERSRILAVLLEVKGSTCWVRGCTTPATTADHIVPDSVSHDHRLENLRPSCLPHNQQRSNGPSGDGAYGARLHIVLDPDRIPSDPDALVLSAPALARALALPPTHPVVRAAMTAATRAASRLTTPSTVVVVDPAMSPSEVETYVDRGAQLVEASPTPTPPAAPPAPSRPWFL